MTRQDQRRSKMRRRDFGAARGQRYARKGRPAWIAGLICGGFVLLMLLPLAMILSGSLMGRQEFLETCGRVLADYDGKTGFRLFPLYPTLRAYVKLLLDSPEYFTAFWNSVIQAAGVLAGQLVIALPGAWAFARYRFPGKKLLWTLYILLMILPFQVTMVSGYLVLNGMHLMDTRAAVIFTGIFSTLPVFILRKSFGGLPAEVIEAARIDGAGELRIFLHIGIPLGMRGIGSVLILGFLEYWNVIEQPMTYLKSRALWPLSMYLPQMAKGDAGAVFAASAVTMLPAVLLFLVGQESLEQGIALSGLTD
jgi:multiple sugar transport system permease protein